MKQHLNPDDLSPPPGGIYSHVVVAGQTVYVSGQLARDGTGNLVGEGDAAVQYAQVWRNLLAALASAGAKPDDLVKTTTYVAGAAHLAAVREARVALGLTDPPASTMIVVAGLADPRFLVEVDAIAVIDG
jgi:enamine deaminase RidA (YjgF/YER057c/UK114 family)